MSPRVEVLGAYRVDADEQAIAGAMEIMYGLDSSSPQYAEAYEDVVRHFSGLVLVEVQVSNRDERFDVGQFHQPDSDQAPYDEAFLSADGTEVLSRFKIPPIEPLRFTFFLHFFDPTRPLETTYGVASVPPLRDMPERLRDLVPYEVPG